MYTKRTTKKRRQVQLIASMIGVIVLTVFTLTMSAGKINAESDLSNNTYKYFTTVYVESGDSLWSIASKYATAEYHDLDMYIEEVKAINGIKAIQLEHGSYICVPYYSTEHK
jgi:LysM domain.